MSKIKSFHDLEIWKLAHLLVLDVYKLTSCFPTKEEYRLTSQLVRAAISIPNNIAEGMGRFSRKEFLQFLSIARGSTEECKYLIILSKDLKYITEESFSSITDRYDMLGKKINALINSLKKKTS
ncbi:MAG: four helix bundle protein [Melioribacteraceae bacterium]